METNFLVFGVNKQTVSKREVSGEITNFGKQKMSIFCILIKKC